MKLSVIICTRNRAHAITGCLDSIAASLSAAAPVAAEIVVVDNGSEDDTSAVVTKWAETAPFPVRLLLETKRGISAARNCALRVVRGELLVFTDDDCRLSEDYAATLLRLDAAENAPVLWGGRIELGDASDLPLTIKTSLIARRWLRKDNPVWYNTEEDAIPGCNMAMRRSVAERVGFFDERFGTGGPLSACEDSDYVFRAWLAGVAIAYVPDMVLFHHHGRKTAPEGWKLLRNYCLGEGALYAKYLFTHPRLCRPLYWDAKKALKEFSAGRNDYLPYIGFSYKEKIIYTLQGTFKYFRLLACSVFTVKRGTS